MKIEGDHAKLPNQKKRRSGDHDIIGADWKAGDQFNHPFILKWA
jgi:hypothetical protein